MTMQTTLSRRKALGALAVAVGLVASGCGGDSSSSSGSGGTAGGDQQTTITVGLVPVADYAPLQLALDKGYFEDEGLTVTLQPLQGGAAAVPGLLSGDLQVSVTNWVSFIQAVEKDLPVRAFYAGAIAKPHWSGVYAPASAGLSGPKDLEGKTVAVTELKTVTELTTRVALEDAGVDPSKVNFTQIPLNTIVAAVQGGTVNSGWLVEPFISQGKAAGLTEVLDVYSGTLEGLSIGGYITSASFAAENPETIQKFQAALAKAVEELNGDEALLRETIVSLSGMPPEAAANLALPTLGEDITADEIQTWADLMHDREFIAEEVTASDVVIED